MILSRFTNKLSHVFRNPLITAFTIFGLVAAARIVWNLLRPDDLFLDSWVMVNVLEGINGQADILPRAALTLHYPLSYLPFLLPAKLLGAYATVKFVYPAAASLAAVPAYLMLRKGPLALAGTLAIVFAPDMGIKTLTGIPQTVALPLFLLALYYTMRQRHTLFVITAAAILFTHHLTGMVVLALYYSAWVLPRIRQAGFLKKELPYLVFFALWPFYWAYAFIAGGQASVAVVLLVLVLAVGLPGALALYWAFPRLQPLLARAGASLTRVSLREIAVAVAVAIAAGLPFMLILINSPGLSLRPIDSSLLIAFGLVLMVTGGAGMLARGNAGLTLFVLVITALGAMVLILGYRYVFDGLRLVDYIIPSLLVLLFAKGLEARWLNRYVLAAVALLVVGSFGLRLASSYQRFYTYSSGMIQAADWVRTNTPQNASIATDTKMSLMILGRGNRNATFEGTKWLFDNSPVETSITELNGQPPFQERPIEYVLLADYMFTQGAEVNWYSAMLKPPPSLPAELDELGTSVYSRDGVTIWDLEAVPQ